MLGTFTVYDVIYDCLSSQIIPKTRSKLFLCNLFFLVQDSLYVKQSNKSFSPECENFSQASMIKMALPLFCYSPTAPPPIHYSSVFQSGFQGALGFFGGPLWVLQDLLEHFEKSYFCTLFMKLK